MSGTLGVAFTLFVKSSFSSTDNSLDIMPGFDTIATLGLTTNHSTAHKPYTFAM